MAATVASIGHYVILLSKPIFCRDGKKKSHPTDPMIKQPNKKALVI